MVILGLDGMDPGITVKLMREGRLPNFAKLAEKGVFRPLGTTYPSMSPVAWSSFTTGVDPSRHCIYDFLTRDPCTYMPMLSSTDIGKAKRVLNIGKYMVPLGKPHIRLLQRSQAFWKLLGEQYIFSIIQRVPITFPPVAFNGLLLSGMCVPDLRGSQGTFSFFSTASKDGEAAFTGGEQTLLRRKGNVIRSRIVGPDNSLVKGGKSHDPPLDHHHRRRPEERAHRNRGLRSLPPRARDLLGLDPAQLQGRPGHQGARHRTLLHHLARRPSSTST